MPVESSGHPEECWTEAIAVCRDAHLPSLVTAVERLQQRWVDQIFHVAVMGQFKRGKSSLLNALVGQPVLPVGVLPVTALPTWIRHGDHPAGESRFRDGGTQRIELSDLAQFVTEKLNPENRRGVERVELQLPSPWLAAGCRLIDTPGIGSVLEHNTESATELIPECDAVLLVVSPDPPVTRAELEFFRRVHRQVSQIYLVLNKVDLIDTASDRDELVGSIVGIARAELHLAAPHVWCVSARTGAGVSALQQELLRFFREDRLRTLRASLRARLRELLQQALGALQVEEQAATMPLQQWDERMEAFGHLRQRTQAERTAIRDGLRGDRERFTTHLREQADLMSQACWAGLRTALAAREAELSHRPARDIKGVVQEMADAHIAEFFATRSSRWLDDAEERAGQVLAAARSRAVGVFQSAAASIAELFLVSVPAGDLPSLPLSRRTFFWRTERTHGAVGGGLRLAALDLLPPARRWAVLLAAFGEDYSMMSSRNANVLYNDVTDRMGAAEQALDSAIEERMTTLLLILEEAMQRGRAARAETASTAVAESTTRKELQGRLQALLESRS